MSRAQSAATTCRWSRGMPPWSYSAGRCLWTTVFVLSRLPCHHRRRHRPPWTPRAVITVHMPVMETVTTAAPGASLPTVPGLLTAGTADHEAAAVIAHTLGMVLVMMVEAGARTTPAHMVLTVQIVGPAFVTTGAPIPAMVIVMMVAVGANTRSVRSAQTVPTAGCEIRAA